MSLVRNIAFFLTAVVFAKAAGFLQSFVLARALGPADFGVWMTLLLIASYSPIISLGAGETMLKKVPYFLGRNMHEQAREIEGGVLAAAILAAVFLLFLGLAVSFILPTASLGVTRT